MTADVVTILKAAEAAARWHAGQRRKGAAGEPYINHPLEVARLVAEAVDGNDAGLIAAAFLHDAVEDQNIPLGLIAAMFGDDTAALVAEVTDDKSLPKAERKRLQVEKAPHKSPRAKLLKLADKISNLRALAESPPADWPLRAPARVRRLGAPRRGGPGRCVPFPTGAIRGGREEGGRGAGRLTRPVSRRLCP